MKPEKKKLMLQLFINSALLITLYFVAVYGLTFPMEIVYLAASAVLGLYFVIYNKGFTRRGVTPEMLPATMSAAEKQAFIEDGERRMEKSRWVLTFLVPMLLSLCVDLLIMLVFPMLGGAN